MNFNEFITSGVISGLADDPGERPRVGAVDFSRAKDIKITRDLYLEADSRGMTLSELLETPEYDPSAADAALDAFERQLALAGVRIGGKRPSTVETFLQSAPTLMPEFMMREIRRGMSFRPELDTLIASSTAIASNRYTPFFIDTSNTDKFALRPIGDGADVPQLLVTEQQHAVNVPDYGLALKASYKSLRYRTTAQFRVLLWYIGFRLQTDKIGLLVNTILNGDGNGNPVTTVNTAVTGVLTYDDLVTLWSQFDSFEMNSLICHVTSMKSILTLNEFKDPLAGFKFQNKGEVFSPLGARLIRSDATPTDIIIGLDTRFAVEQVITQPLTVEFDKVIEQRFEEAVISESVAYARVIGEAAFALDTSF
ncbi:MAG TPA: hypothetical protein VLB27_09810 [candidate division Zixibacteria bacterium]|nr:hypothetical protein [candidate division Zixibacteria bacterium]